MNIDRTVHDKIVAHLKNLPQWTTCDHCGRDISPEENNNTLVCDWCCEEMGQPQRQELIMLEIANQDYLAEVKQFAKDTNQIEQLQTKLDYLDTYAEHGDRGVTMCKLFPDFAPYSFQFQMCQMDKETKEYIPWFHGGLIYFGPGENGVSDPQYTVRIGDTSQSGWSVHT